MLDRHAVVDILDQDHRYKWVATKIPYDAALAPPAIDRKFLLQKGSNQRQMP